MIKSKIIKFGNNVDTDQIIPAQHLNLPTLESMIPFVFDYDENYKSNYIKGDIIVAGENFGCGSSREQAPAVLKLAGVKVIIAKEFSRIFFRNSINLGLCVIQCDETDKFNNLDTVVVDLQNSMITNFTQNTNYRIKAFSEFEQDIIKCNGIVNYINKINK